MIQFCHVHFKHNLARIARNGRIIKDHTENEFKSDVLHLFYFSIGQMPSFLDHSLFLVDKYPLAHGFLMWYMRPNVATVLFESCKHQNTHNKLLDHWKSLPNNTNPQENVGKQIQEAWPSKNKIID
jgi:hypothetical protein